MLLVVAHWMACLWGFTGHGTQDGWMEAVQQGKGDAMRLDQPRQMYVAALHFAVMTITCPRAETQRWSSSGDREGTTACAGL